MCLADGICPHLHFSILSTKRTARRKETLMPCPTIPRPWGFIMPIVHEKETQFQLLQGRDHQSHAACQAGGAAWWTMWFPHPLTAFPCSLSLQLSPVTCLQRAAIAQPVDAWCKQIFQDENFATGTLQENPSTLKLCMVKSSNLQISLSNSSNNLRHLGINLAYTGVSVYRVREGRHKI